MPTPTLARSSGDRARRQRLAVVAEAEAAAADRERCRRPSLQMIDAAQQRAFAGPAGTEQRDDLADAHGQIEPVEHGCWSP